MIETTEFGATGAGDRVQLFRCVNAQGLTLKLTNFGAIVVSVETPDRRGRTANITLGFPDWAGYQQRHPYFGATVGRYGNRIANAAFQLDGETVRLAANTPPHHLHGGVRGFDRYVWGAAPFEANGEVGVVFRMRSPDGDEGYPGTLDVEATYALKDDNSLRMEYRATSNKPTPINLTNHCYWNLAGVDVSSAPSVFEHELQVEADQYVAVDENLIPTGELPSIAGTPLDFREAKLIGADVYDVGADPDGYDHCYVVRGDAGRLRRAAKVMEPTSGRTMEVWTDQRGMQLYTGNFLDGSGSCGGFSMHTAFCLETQHYPDSPNQPSFPSTVLRPGATYHHQTIHRFGVRD